MVFRFWSFISFCSVFRSHHYYAYDILAVNKCAFLYPERIIFEICFENPNTVDTRLWMLFSTYNALKTIQNHNRPLNAKILNQMITTNKWQTSLVSHQHSLELFFSVSYISLYLSSCCDDVFVLNSRVECAICFHLAFNSLSFLCVMHYNKTTKSVQLNKIINKYRFWCYLWLSDIWVWTLFIHL